MPRQIMSIILPFCVVWPGKIEPGNFCAVSPEQPSSGWIAQEQRTLSGKLSA